MRVIKKDTVITGIDFAIPYYERLHGLAVYLSSKEDEDAKQHLATVLILINTLDKKAEEQGLIEEMEIPLNIIPVQQ